MSILTFNRSKFKNISKKEILFIDDRGKENSIKQESVNQGRIKNFNIGKGAKYTNYAPITEIHSFQLILKEVVVQ